jgi:hypothetical protein
MAARRKTCKRGKFVPRNPEKYIGNVDNITYRSSWEEHFANWCDLNKNILLWNSEEVVVKYYSKADQRYRRYFVDFYIKYVTKSGEVREEIIEVKPFIETQPPARKKGKRVSRFEEELYTYNVNLNKWQAASEYAKKRGWKFRILTENELFTR